MLSRQVEQGSVDAGQDEVDPGAGLENLGSRSVAVQGAFSLQSRRHARADHLEDRPRPRPSSVSILMTTFDAVVRTMLAYRNGREGPQALQADGSAHRRRCLRKRTPWSRRNSHPPVHALGWAARAGSGSPVSVASHSPRISGAQSQHTRPPARMTRTQAIRAVSML